MLPVHLASPLPPPQVPLPPALQGQMTLPLPLPLLLPLEGQTTPLPPKQTLPM